MEIAYLQKTGVRIKGKSAAFAVNTLDVASGNAALLLDDMVPDTTGEDVYLSGPGDYEIGGVKITGYRGDKGFIYSLTIDGVSVVIGKIETLSSMQNKLKEHQIVVALCKETANASFLTSLAENAVVVYGEKAAETLQGFEKEKIKEMNKYSAVAGKLSTELETILLN